MNAHEADSRGLVAIGMCGGFTISGGVALATASILWQPFFVAAGASLLVAIYYAFMSARSK